MRDFLKCDKEALRMCYSAKINSLNEGLKKDLLALNVGFNEKVSVAIWARYIIIALAKDEKTTVWASEVQIYLEPSKEAKMSYPASGDFDPNTDEGSKWRTLHAAAIIKNWEQITVLAQRYCAEYSRILEEYQRILTERF